MRSSFLNHAPFLMGVAGAGFFATTAMLASAEQSMHRNAASAYTAAAPSDEARARQPSIGSVDRGELVRRAGFPAVPEKLVETLTKDAAQSVETDRPLGYNGTIDRERLDGIIDEASRTTGLEERLIRAVVRTESDNRPSVVSRAGAVGLMQVRPVAAAAVASRVPGWQESMQERARAGEIQPEDLLDPRFNVLLGSHYLAYLHERFQRHEEPMRTWLMLMAYNWGIGNVHRHITSSADLRNLEDLRWLLRVRAPYETRAFVHRVLERSGLRGEMLQASSADS